MLIKGKPLETRTFHQRNPRLSFFCPLCRTQREFVYSEKLPLWHLMLSFLIATILMIPLYSLMEVRVFIIPFMTWGIYELVWKLLHRKEIPCPHCGFDAVWYKRDIRVAKKMVEDFWKKKNKPPEENSEENKVVEEDEEIKTATS